MAIIPSISFLQVTRPHLDAAYKGPKSCYASSCVGQQLLSANHHQGCCVVLPSIAKQEGIGGTCMTHIHSCVADKHEACMQAVISQLTCGYRIAVASTPRHPCLSACGSHQGLYRHHHIPARLHCLGSSPPSRTAMAACQQQLPETCTASRSSHISTHLRPLFASKCMALLLKVCLLGQNGTMHHERPAASSLPASCAAMGDGPACRS